MANLLAIILTIVCTIVSTTALQSGSTSATNFIKASCKSTTYPAICVQSLSTYAATIKQSQCQLAQTALTVSVATVQSTKMFVYKLAKFKGLKKREYEAIQDCIDEMGDTTDRLSKSIQELKHVGETKSKDFRFHMSNVQTWVSAALTDENTCTDGFAGRAMNGKLKSSIRGQVVKVAQVTSNALALVNQYASGH